MKRLAYLILVLPFSLPGQDLFNDGGVIAITNGLPVTVSHSLINTGSIVNNGSLAIGKNLVNTGTYRTDGEGTLILNGPNEQLINTVSPVGRLRLQNGDKQLNSDLHISQELVLENARLLVEANYAVHLEEGATVGYQDGDYIVGKLFMTGQDNLFPVGTEDLALPVRIVTQESREIGVEAVPEILSNMLDNTISEIADFYWMLDTPDEFAGAEVTLDIEDATFLEDIENARVGEALAVNGIVTDGGNGGTTGSVAAGKVTSGKLIKGPYITLAKRFTAAEKPPVNVLNLISPNNDGQNDHLVIENITAYPQNLVSIYDRWGKKVYEQAGYDNGEKLFGGYSNLNTGKELPEGTYYYVISSGSGVKLASGFLELIR